MLNAPRGLEYFGLLIGLLFCHAEYARRVRDRLLPGVW